MTATRILLLGRNGQVGTELSHALRGAGDVVALGRSECDLSQPERIRTVVQQVAPDVIVNAAGATKVDQAEHHEALTMQVNAVAPSVLAEEACRLGALLIHYSTDYVYDGRTTRPYREDDPPHPVNVYGHSKLAGERAIAATGCDHLILRTSWVYSAHGTNFVDTILKLGRERDTLKVVQDQIGSPSWARELARHTVPLVERHRETRQARGIYHFSAGGHVSRYDFTRAIIELARRHTGPEPRWAELEPITTADYPLPAQRPLNCATDKHKLFAVFGLRLPDWETQLQTYLEERLA